MADLDLCFNNSSDRAELRIYDMKRPAYTITAFDGMWYFHTPVTEKSGAYTDLSDCWYDLILEWYSHNQDEVAKYHFRDAAPYRFGLSRTQFKQVIGGRPRYDN